MLISRLFGVAMAAAFLLTPTFAQAQAQSHIALVVGNSTYAGRQLSTTHGDADIVAETMRAAGYDVTELYDVRQADIGPALRDFLDKVAAAGPDAVAFFYYAGEAAQAGTENYLVPVDAQIDSIGDVPAQSLRSTSSWMRSRQCLRRPASWCSMLHATTAMDAARPGLCRQALLSWRCPPAC